METIGSTEFIRAIGKWQDVAAQEPVTVTRNGRERFVMLPYAEYQRLKHRDVEALKLEELSQQDIAAIVASAEPAHYAFADTLEALQGQ